LWFVWFIWFLWFIRLVWFNQINETNQTHQSNQPVLTLHGYRERRENAAGGRFQHPAVAGVPEELQPQEGKSATGDK